VITIGEWENLSPEEQKADIARWHALFVAVGLNINALDENDPVHVRKRDEDASDEYDTVGSTRTRI
jgi:hypothetical protein